MVGDLTLDRPAVLNAPTTSILRSSLCGLLCGLPPTNESLLWLSLCFYLLVSLFNVGGQLLSRLVLDRPPFWMVVVD